MAYCMPFYTATKQISKCQRSLMINQNNVFSSFSDVYKKYIVPKLKLKIKK
jgi:hypothetical protein